MNEGKREIWREALRATSLGWDLALPIFGGVLLGHLLDRTLDTTYVFTLGLLFLGIAIGFYNVVQAIERVDRRSRQRGERAGEREETEDHSAP